MMFVSGVPLWHYLKKNTPSQLKTVGIGETVSLLYSSIRINSSYTVNDGDKFIIQEGYDIDFTSGSDYAGSLGWTVNVDNPSVVPEAISSILLVIGGTLLAEKTKARKSLRTEVRKYRELHNYKSGDNFRGWLG